MFLNPGFKTVLTFHVACSLGILFTHGPQFRRYLKKLSIPAAHLIKVDFTAADRNQAKLKTPNSRQTKQKTKTPSTKLKTQNEKNTNTETHIKNTNKVTEQNHEIEKSKRQNVH